jgi:hypothetical protein
MLSAPRFAGDSVLEACLAGQHRMMTPEQGPAVQAVQQALIDLGFDIPSGPTGFFGNETSAAVVAFKQMSNLSPADPVVGSGTMTALDAAFAVEDLPARAVSPPGSRPCAAPAKTRAFPASWS